MDPGTAGCALTSTKTHLRFNGDLLGGGGIIFGRFQTLSTPTPDTRSRQQPPGRRTQNPIFFSISHLNRSSSATPLVILLVRVIWVACAGRKVIAAVSESSYSLLIQGLPGVEERSETAGGYTRKYFLSLISVYPHYG